MRRTAAIALAALAALASLAARAEQSVDGAAPYSAAARIDLRVVIPGFLRFRVGNAGATINERRPRDLHRHDALSRCSAAPSAVDRSTGGHRSNDPPQMRRRCMPLG